ncbi:hypothetical protein RHSIM_Rhsim01G0218100 [Rhododendron simsii]|uniref:Protein transport protein Sec61 subunit beta n=1 Tax=Rhododendron simsii TaxID=118357 RepID=A0A834HHK8_RHOSS|nr:hypothetical protein RHSIM_Rhsim01G0218100 [Rhododendron simsii]
MARGTSQSQASSSSTSRPGPIAPRGSAAATAGMRRRRTTTSAGNSSSGSGSFGGGAGSGSNVLRFYTDDAPGLKISPTVVLVMSLCFIGFVTALHVFAAQHSSWKEKFLGALALGGYLDRHKKLTTDMPRLGNLEQGAGPPPRFSLLMFVRRPEWDRLRDP